MTGKNCPSCGAALEPSVDRDKVVCPGCGKEYDYNTLNAEARAEIDRKRWEREKESRTGEAARKRKRITAAAPVAVTAVPVLAVLVAAITLFATGDALSFVSAAPAIVALIFVVFGGACASAAWLVVKVRKKVYNGPVLYASVSVSLAVLLAMSVVSVALAMGNYGRLLSDGYVYTAGADGAELVEYRGETTENFSIPGSIGGLNVVGVGKGLLKGNDVVRSLTVPEGVKVIENEAFRGMKNLEAAALPSTLKRINRSAFSDCIGLKKIIVPDNVTFIGASAFSECTALKEIDLPFVGENRDREVHEHFGYIFGAIDYDHNSDALPASLKIVRVRGGKIAANAFNGCAGITSLALENITEAGDNAFFGCTGLKSLTLPATVEKLSDYAFAGWTAGQSLYIPESLAGKELRRCEAAINYY